MSNLEKDFVPHTEALELKQLRFDEECFRYIYTGDTGNNYDHYLMGESKNYNEDMLCISQPTYSQAFRWFRKKGYRFSVIMDSPLAEEESHYIEIWFEKQFLHESHYIYKTYEDGELGLLKKINSIRKRKTTMKNIHVIPTDKPSRLGQSVFDNSFHYNPNFYELEEKRVIPQNIYITSDEEIKPNVFALINSVLCKTEIKEGKIVSRQLRGGATMDICKTEYLQILLTTDPDLIKDGVQAIDDKFLEWFVKNPSCEFVNVECSGRNCIEEFGCTKEVCNGVKPLKIIISQEEPKQEGYICPHTKLQCNDECCVSAEDCHITSSLATGIVDCDKPKQETLENESIFKNKKWYSENGTVYNEADDSVRIALVFDNGSYMNLPIEIANKISQLLNK